MKDSQFSDRLLIDKQYPHPCAHTFTGFLPRLRRGPIRFKNCTWPGDLNIPMHCTTAYGVSASAADLNRRLPDMFPSSESSQVLYSLEYQRARRLFPMSGKERRSECHGRSGLPSSSKKSRLCISVVRLHSLTSQPLGTCKL